MVTLETGPVFADMRVVGINTVDLLVDNSMITGDPEPIPRQVRLLGAHSVVLYRLFSCSHDDDGRWT